MKRFHLITEADARVLDYGSTVVLVAGGHVTPLAQDTLRDKRVTVVREDGADAPAGLAPASVVRTVAVSGDESSHDLRSAIIAHIRRRGLAAHDMAAPCRDPSDFAEAAATVARAVARREADIAVVVDQTGLGSAIAANKVRGIRAAMCVSEALARMARERNGANVLTLGSTLVTREQAVAIVDAFIDTPMQDARHIRRLARIAEIERSPER